jgi:DNA-binding beta-propeller fold protein YncE
VDAGDAGPVERVDSAGLTLVRNRAPERPLEWRFERVLTLGGVDEGPEAFARLGAESVGVDDAGNLYVADGANHRVRVFDASGAPVREMGGRGAGPGEFEFMGAFAVAGDGAIRVADFSKNGLVAFGPQGDTQPLIALPGFSGPRLRFVDGALANVITPPRTSPDTTVRARLAVLEADDTIALVIAPPGPRVEMKELPRCPIRVAFPPLLAPSLEWDARGGRIAVADGVDYAVGIWERGADGWRQVRRVTRALPLLPATLEIAAAEYPDSFRIRGGSASCAIGPIEIAETLGYAEVAPHVKDVALAPDGALWVRHRTGDEDVTRIDVFDAGGAYLGTLPGDAPFPAAFRGSGEIVTVEADELDRPLVVVWSVLRD